MDIVFIPFLVIVQTLLRLYTLTVIVRIALVWLIVFQIVNPYQIFVRAASDFCHRLTAKPLAWIQRFVPPMGSFDFSPMVLLLGLYFCQMMIERLIYRLGA